RHELAPGDAKKTALVSSGGGHGSVLVIPGTGDHGKPRILFEARIGFRQFAQQEYRAAVRCDAARVHAIRAQPERKTWLRNIALSHGWFLVNKLIASHYFSLPNGERPKADE